MNPPLQNIFISGGFLLFSVVLKSSYLTTNSGYASSPHSEISTPSSSSSLDTRIPIKAFSPTKARMMLQKPR